MDQHRINEKILEHMRYRYFGKYRGKVISNNDDTNRGRLQVVVPAVLGDIKVWALPCLPYTGNGVGTYWLPEKDAGVWIEFEAGDCSYPIWTGGYWADDQLPKNEQSQQAKPAVRSIRSEKGLMVTMNDDKEILTISDKDGSNIMTIDVQAGKIRIHGKMKVVVDGPQIELVEGANQHLVFGEQLITYLQELYTIFNTHMHVGEMALGVFPVAPSPPAVQFPMPSKAILLSNKVTTG